MEKKALHSIFPKAVINSTKSYIQHFVINSTFKVSFEQKPHQIPPLGIRIQPDLCAVGFLRRNVLKCSILATFGSAGVGGLPAAAGIALRRRSAACAFSIGEATGHSCGGD